MLSTDHKINKIITSAPDTRKINSATPLTISAATQSIETVHRICENSPGLMERGHEFKLHSHLSKRKFAAALCVISACMLSTPEKIEKRKRKKRSVWVQDWLKKRTNEEGQEFQEIETQKFIFTNYLCMEEETFNELLELISPRIQKQDTTMRMAIPPKERLAVTLRYLTTGDSFKKVSKIFRIAPNTISTIVEDVCRSIYLTLRDKYMQVPSTTEEWEAVAAEFETKWNFPNCIGALDGKHIIMKTQAHLDISNNSNKCTHCGIVLMAVVDANYKFLYVDVGSNGHVSDDDVFNKSSFSFALKSNDLNLPTPRPLPGGGMDIPFVLVADDAFAMHENLMKPYLGPSLTAEQRIFNYRLSRARHVVDNAFSILERSFQLFSRPIHLDVNKAILLTLASCALHNYLLTKSTNYASFGCNSASMLQTDSEIEDIPTWYIPTQAKSIREEYEKYFMSLIGELPMQNQFI